MPSKCGLLSACGQNFRMIMKQTTLALLTRFFLILAAGLIFVGPALAADAPASTAPWWNPDYSLRKRILIDTAASGAGISDPIGTTPVLIRLSGDFNFDAAGDNGSNLRFVGADGKPLAFHVEQFDSVLGEAYVWLKVPDLKPGAQTTIYLYYGKNGDKPVDGGPDPKATYDAETVLVYHFAEKSGDAPQDVTVSANNAKNGGASTDGSIGPALRLDGKTPISIPASSTLAVAAGGSLTWSAWVKPTLLQPNAVIYSCREGTSDFLVGCDNGAPFVEINGTRSPLGAPITAGSWHFLAVVANSSSAVLYVDGAIYGQVNVPLPALSGAALIGGDVADPNATTPTVGFNGAIDELNISKTARSSGFVKVAATNGDAAAKLVTVSPDEQPPAGWLSGAFGLFGVILKSVTIDGWVVIGILGIMAIVSWYVMITKFFYLNGVQKGNKLFLKSWSQVALDLTVLDHNDAEKVKSMGGNLSPKLQRLIHNSPLYRIYHIGSREIGVRMAGDRILSSRSIQAIRASLDGGYVRENHSLNDGMVFLTISIAGGPFMGLLGTVVGVMITFAAIAATGEVNISAIAPGLAAALVATVAGLLVAIPALLGYNYLTSRMKNVTSDLQVFIDEFVTKMAEFYSNMGE